MTDCTMPRFEGGGPGTGDWLRWFSWDGKAVVARCRAPPMTPEDCTELSAATDGMVIKESSNVISMS